MEEQQDKWIETSRYKTVRKFTFIPPNQVEVICEEVLWCSFNGSPEYITAIDPDGGPCLPIGKIIKNYKITKILSYMQPYKGEKKTMRIVLEVIKIEN